MGILSKKAEYRDPSSSRALSRLHAQLTQMGGIMQHNLEELLMRGESLEDVTFKAKCLSETSQRFSSSARLLALSALAKKFGVAQPKQTVWQGEHTNLWLFLRRTLC